MKRWPTIVWAKRRPERHPRASVRGPEEGDVYAVAHVEESQDGELYWDSNDDIVHGMLLPYVSHWCSLTPPAL